MGFNSPKRRSSAIARRRVLDAKRFVAAGDAIGETITKILSPEQRERCQPWFDNARRLRELVTDLETVSLDAIEDAENWKPTWRRDSFRVRVSHATPKPQRLWTDISS